MASAADRGPLPQALLSSLSARTTPKTAPPALSDIQITPILSSPPPPRIHVLYESNPKSTATSQGCPGPHLHRRPAATTALAPPTNQPKPPSLPARPRLANGHCQACRLTCLAPDGPRAPSRRGRGGGWLNGGETFCTVADGDAAERGWPHTMGTSQHARRPAGRRVDGPTRARETHLRYALMILGLELPNVAQRACVNFFKSQGNLATATGTWTCMEKAHKLASTSTTTLRDDYLDKCASYPESRTFHATYLDEIKTFKYLSHRLDTNYKY